MTLSLSLLYLTVLDRWRHLLAFRSPRSSFHNPPLVTHCNISQLSIAVCSAFLSCGKPSPSSFVYLQRRCGIDGDHFCSATQFEGPCFSRNPAWLLYINHGAIHSSKGISYFHQAYKVFNIFICSSVKPSVAVTGQNVDDKNKRMFVEGFHEMLTRKICATLWCLVENGQGNLEGMAL